MRNNTKFFFLSLTFIYTVSIAAFFLPVKTISAYAFSYVLSSVLYIILARHIIKYEISGRMLAGLVILSIIIRAALLPVKPVGSDDYYRYVWDGKVQAHGINPYEYAPSDSALASLHTAELPAKVSYPDMKTIYPPLSQIIFYAAYIIGGDAYTGLKILLMLFELLTMFVLYLILKRKGLPLKNILLYTLCPLPVFQFFIDAHVDVFGLPLLILSILFFIDNKKIISLAFLGLSLCIKPLGLILVPVYFLEVKSFKEKLMTVLIPAGICAAAYIPYMFTGNPFQALMKFTENWTFNGVVFDVLDSFIHDNQKTRLICAIILMISSLPLIISRKNLLVKIYLSVFLLLIFSPIVHPWYAAWLAVLLPFVPRRSGIAYAGLISLTVFTVLNYQLTGVWNEYTWVLVLEYVPVLSLFLYEIFFEKKSGGKILERIE